MRDGRFSEVAAGLERALGQGGAKADAKGHNKRTSPRSPHIKLPEELSALALGVAYLKLSRFKEAIAVLDRVPDGTPLAPHARYYGAFAAYHARDLAGATRRAQAVSASSPIDNDARLLKADALYVQKAWQPLATQCEGILATYPRSIRLSEVRARLAESYARLGRPLASQLPLYQAIWIEDPASRHARDAEKRLQASPKSLRFDAARLAVRAHALFDAMRNADSEAAFLAALSVGTTDVDLECDLRFHLAQSVFKARDRPRAAPLFDEAAAVCARSQNEDLAMKSLYQAGRTHASANDYEVAIKLFLAAEAAHPKHSYADDSRLRAAESTAALPITPEREAQVTELLSSIPTRYPEGDMKGEALWRLAFRDWRAGKWQGALSWLERQAALPHETRWDAEGQAYYWQARVLEKLGKTGEARASYQKAVREYPLSVYALLALNRLRRTAPALMRKLVADLKTTPPAKSAELAPGPGSARPEYGDVRFQRALLLLSIGLGSDAQRELAALGMKPPAERNAKLSPEQSELLGVAAELYDRAGAYDQSHWIMRHTLTSYKLGWPVGDLRHVWRVAYPRGYTSLLAKEAKTLGHPLDLAQAIVREESAFSATLESFANAIGLMQMIMPTATRFAKDAGVVATPDSLRDPSTNVAIGSRFLAFLWKRFKGNAGLVVAGYNAGEGGVERWLKQRGELDLDEFLESIPYDETRGYSKRVLNSYFVYRWLAWLDGAGGEPVPELDFKLK